MDLKKQVETLLKQGDIDIFLGFRTVDGHTIPQGFTMDNLDDLAEITDAPERYPLEKTAVRLKKDNPDITIGLLARDCNKRALNVLVTWNQLDGKTVTTVDQNCCPSKLRLSSDCSYLNTHKTGSVKQKTGVDPSMDPDTFIDAFDPEERFSRWMYEFSKCIKCYGCRNICPVWLQHSEAEP